MLVFASAWHCVMIELLTPKYQQALDWFTAHKGHRVSRDALRRAPVAVVGRWQGIFKPKDHPFALSVCLPADTPVLPLPREGWTCRCPLPGHGTHDADHLHTVQAMQACRQDNIPFGVLVADEAGEDCSSYRVLGLARVVAQEDSYFVLEGIGGPGRCLYDPLAGETCDPFLPGNWEEGRGLINRHLTARRGHADFREALLQAYDARCAISDCRVELLLEAVHIALYLGEDTNAANNGLLLRSDLHTLWDLGQIYLDDEFRVQCMPPLRHGEYAAWQGRTIRLPDDPACHPSRLALRSHRDWCMGRLMTGH